MARQLFISGDQHVLVESSRSFVNVRISVNGCEPVAIPGELLEAVATSLHIARIELAAANGSKRILTDEKKADCGLLSELDEGSDGVAVPRGGEQG